MKPAPRKRWAEQGGFGFRDSTKRCSSSASSNATLPRRSHLPPMRRQAIAFRDCEIRTRRHTASRLRRRASTRRFWRNFMTPGMTAITAGTEDRHRRHRAGVQTLRVAYTPDSDDAFNFYAWEHDRVGIDGV